MTLTWTIALPFLGSLAILLGPKSWARWTALLFAALTLIPAALLVAGYDSTATTLQFVEDRSWIAFLNVRYILGTDGLSFPLVILTALLGVVCVLASWNIEKQVKGYFSLFLFLQGSMTGVFVAIDLFLFYVFWELMLLPMYFLIGIWGSPSRVDPDGRTRGGPYAAIKFFLYTLVGSLLMLVGIIWLWNGAGTFDLRHLQEPGRDLQAQLILWSLFFVAFAVKIPMFPFHTWLPDAHVEAPTAVSVVLAGVLLKMGTYGILRINYPLFPDATFAMATFVGLFGVINILYGALCAMAQDDMKRLVAYSSISHMGYVMLGMSAFFVTGTNQAVSEAILGGVLQMWNHGTITAMLFLLVGVFYDRAHHRDIRRMGGLAKTMPIYTGFVTLAFFASLGFPGLSGFISEMLVLMGGWKAGGVFRYFVLSSAVGIVITAAYHLWFIKRAFLGKENPECAGHPEISAREIATLVPMALIVVWVGVWPAPMVRVLETSVMGVVKIVLEAAAR